MRRLHYLLAIPLLSVACKRDTPRPDQSATTQDSSSSVSVPQRASVDTTPGYRITSVEAHLYSTDSTPVTPNIIDNAKATLFNVAGLRLRITVMVRWGPHETRPARLSLWARVNGKPFFEQDTHFVPSPDSTVRVQDFWLDHGHCDGLLIRAYVLADGPVSEAYRYIPYECGD